MNGRKDNPRVGKPWDWLHPLGRTKGIAHAGGLCKEFVAGDDFIVYPCDNLIHYGIIEVPRRVLKWGILSIQPPKRCRGSNKIRGSKIG